MSSQEAPSLEQQLQNLEKSLARTSGRLARGAIVTRVVGIALLCLVCGYFVYGYTEIKTLIDPNFIVPMAGNMLDDAVPQLRKSLHETVAASAPVWAESLSTAAIQAAPTAREGLENYVLEQTSGVLDDAVKIGEEHLRQALQENRAEMEQALKQLAKDEQYSEETLKIFVEALNKELGRDMQEQAHEVLGTLIGLKEKLQHLAGGKSLSRDEILERHTLMTVRHLQLREADAEFAERVKKRDQLYAEAEEKEGEKPGAVGVSGDAAPAVPGEAAKPAEPAAPEAAGAETKVEVKKAGT